MRHHETLNVLAGHGVGMTRLPLGWIVSSHVLAPRLKSLLLVGAEHQCCIQRLLYVSQRTCHFYLLFTTFLIVAHPVFLISAH